MKNSKRNNKSTAAVSESTTAVMDQPTEQVEQVTAPEVSDAQPTGKAAPFAAPTEADSLKYGVTTETSFIAQMLIAGKHTKEAIKSAFLNKFAGDDAAEIKRKKTTFSVFFSDVKRPIGTYHASRGLVLVTNDEGIISVTPKSLAAATTALAAGILTDLKGINVKKHPNKYAAVLAKHNLIEQADASEEESTEE